jgi:hypothetical protein
MNVVNTTIARSSIRTFNRELNVRRPGSIPIEVVLVVSKISLYIDHEETLVIILIAGKGGAFCTRSTLFMGFENISKNETYT